MYGLLIANELEYFKSIASQDTFEEICKVFGMPSVLSKILIFHLDKVISEKF